MSSNPPPPPAEDSEPVLQHVLSDGTIVAERYRVDGILGQGGMGIVYQATQLALRRPVALKVLSASLSRDVKFRERFEREGLAQAALEHPHIVPVHEAGQSEHGLFLAMRLIRGPTLRDLILAREVTPEIALHLLVRVADALDTAHRTGLIHRDVKPQNILIAERHHPFLADFGLTKDESEPSLTSSGQFLGTLDYVAPEQIEGHKPQPQTDVYALTGVLFECLTGSVPYPRDTNAAVLYAHMTSPPPRVQDHRTDLPAAIDDVIARGMAKEPEDRPGSAGELLAEAEAVLGAESSAVQRVPGPLQAPEQAGIRSPKPRRADTTRDAQARVATGEVGATTAAAATRPARRPESRTRLIWLAAAGLVTLAVAGFGVGRLGGSEDAERKFANFASAGSLELSFPSDWQRASQGVTVPGLEFREPLSLGRSSGGRAELTAGQVSATGPALLPAKLLSLLGRAPSRGDVVRLGRLTAYRYSRLRPSGTDGTFKLLVIPTTEGVATVACRTAQAGAGDCERIASTLQLTSGKAFSLSPDRAYQQRLDEVLSRLRQERSSGRRDLKSAKTASGQARRARSIERSYRRARRSLRGAQVSPAAADANAQVTRGLRNAERAYAALATAAKGESSSAYRSAKKSVSTAERAVERGLAGLAALGYSVKG